MPYPDNFSSGRFEMAYGPAPSPDDCPFAATAADVAAIKAVRAASAEFLAALKAHSWHFDCAETVSHADHVAEHTAIDLALEAAVAEAEASWKAAA